MDDMQNKNTFYICLTVLDYFMALNQNMGSKERIQRQKEDTRKSILDAALQIVKQEGWSALSMRKIADVIEYTAPIIYEYFTNKEGILFELTRQGYMHLGVKVKAARDSKQDPEEQLEAMWLAYWDFAFAERELYQVMFGIEVNCCEMSKKLPESDAPFDLVSEAIEQLMDHKPTEDEVCIKYYTFWSVIHGLISINLVSRGNSDEVNQQVLRTAISGIIRSIKE